MKKWKIQLRQVMTMNQNLKAVQVEVPLTLQALAHLKVKNLDLNLLAANLTLQTKLIHLVLLRRMVTQLVKIVLLIDAPSALLNQI
jgi:hypothetical protein